MQHLAELDVINIPMRTEDNANMLDISKVTTKYVHDHQYANMKICYC